MHTHLMSRVLFLLALCFAVGCSPIPRKYLKEADPSVTLTTIKRNASYYQDKLVLLGGVIMEEKAQDGRLWLHVENRPLDQDFRPQLPPSTSDPESGWYWVVVGSHGKFPANRRHWADMTVVGRVAGISPGKEPILRMVYVRGWGLKSEHDGAWEEIVDANYILDTPSGAVGEMGQP